MNQANKILEQLISQFDIIALKSSFEDEGAEALSQVLLTKLCSKYNLKTIIKIGGCEAKSDFLTCKVFDTDILVAPMVETEYASLKFLSLIDEIYKEDKEKKEFFINIETKTAVENIDSILNTVNKKINGFVIGRSDLTESLGIGKKEVNSEKTYMLVKNVLLKIKQHGYITNMGGNVNQDGELFVRNLYNDKLLDRVETRLVVVAVNDKLINNYQKFVNLAIDLEKELLNFKIKQHSYYVSDMQKRVNSIKSRSEFLNPILSSENKLIMIDFDNVIHSMDKGFHDGTIYGNPIDGTKEALEKLFLKYDISIYSCKANPDRPLIEGKNGIELIWEWLHKHNLAKFIKSVTYDKLNAVAYIDDKAIEFINWNDCLLKFYNRKLLDE